MRIKSLKDVIEMQILNKFNKKNKVYFYLSPACSGPSVSWGLWKLQRDHLESQHEPLQEVLLHWLTQQQNWACPFILGT